MGDVLVSGVTGQLGLGLIEARRDRRQADGLLALVRPWRVPAGRPPRVGRSGLEASALVTGDVTEPMWGLLSDDLDRLSESVDCVVNLAANTDWIGGSSELARTNVVGALAGLDVAIELGRRRGTRVPYVQASSVFVAGSATGRVPEAMQPPAASRTSYERSKWLAELYLWEAAQRADHPLLIARFAGLIGNSRSGDTAHRGSLYLLLDMMGGTRLKVVPATAGARVDVLPRDVAGHLLQDLIDGASDLTGPSLVHVALGDHAPLLTTVLTMLGDHTDGRPPLRAVTVPQRSLLWGLDRVLQTPSLPRDQKRMAAGLRCIALDRVFATRELRRLVGEELVTARRPDAGTIVNTLVPRLPIDDGVSAGRDWS